MFLLIVNVLLLAAGNFMEPSSIILIMAPILFPAAISSASTPCIFGILIDGQHGSRPVPSSGRPQPLRRSGIAKHGHHRTYRRRLPWLLTMLMFLVMVTYWPALSLWLPHLLGVRY